MKKIFELIDNNPNAVPVCKEIVVCLVVNLLSIRAGQVKDVIIKVLHVSNHRLSIRIVIEGILKP